MCCSTLNMASIHVYCSFYLQQTLTLTSTDQTVCHSEPVREADETSTGNCLREGCLRKCHSPIRPAFHHSS